ncbi:amino acid ABC transporter permease [Klebsiella pneumoniae]|uniref:amino acid ABC transporter permease n=1 Tax=Klebsiella pneumoniae TaxID=573 RepID=UPI000D44A0DC|nr:amino acid ABC transporter permease [Klebsiella pneumoniae]ELA2702168.1 amino acid ABC transporter permease [Klebsiella pneumoniae]MDW2587960.1 amino acid ABC transporter permease [Klebsiella pneumoniae]MDW2612723.1 amino acid ABC transporter permease [Klebsiella pneumoniae]MDW2618313.1 amino acid ABC transporter permease [Klebsiella pneumoniae]MDW2690491.1 amino acid ABC transporter permease [Klebsiella pneumoniae]
MTEQLHFSELWPHWPELLAGLWVTVQLTVLATIGGLAIGILGAAIRSGRPGMLSRVWGGYVEIIRNTPFVVQLFFIVFGLPNLGLKMTAGEAALLAMVVNLGAYSTEIVRAGIQVTPKGQWEASRCLGLSFGQTLYRVVAPQALRIAIAPTVGFAVQVIKGTALASIIGFVELTKAGTMLTNVTYQPFKVFALVALGYFILCYPLSRYSRYLENKFNASHHH